MSINLRTHYAHWKYLLVFFLLLMKQNVLKAIFWGGRPEKIVICFVDENKQDDFLYFSFHPTLTISPDIATVIIHSTKTKTKKVSTKETVLQIDSQIYCGKPATTSTTLYCTQLSKFISTTFSHSQAIQKFTFYLCFLWFCLFICVFILELCWFWCKYPHRNKEENQTIFWPINVRSPDTFKRCSNSSTLQLLLRLKLWTLQLLLHSYYIVNVLITNTHLWRINFLFVHQGKKAIAKLCMLQMLFVSILIPYAS